MYLLTDTDISMFLQQQLNYFHLTIPAGYVESSSAILCMGDICNNESYTSLSGSPQDIIMNPLISIIYNYNIHIII